MYSIKITRYFLKSEPESTQNQRKTTPKKKCNKEDNSSPFVPPHTTSILDNNNHTNTKKRVETCQFYDTTKNKSNNKGDNADQKYCQKHWKKLHLEKFEQPVPRSVGGPSLRERVQKLKAKTIGDTKVTKQLMVDAPTLLEKCIINRCESSPTSDVFEQVIKHDLKLENAPDKMSGDASKNGLNIEIKCSTHAKDSSFNFVQIRPDHNVHFYLFVGYNLWHADRQALGKEYLFKIPSEDLYNMVVEHGGYAHGSKMVLPAITLATMKGNGYEYALRVNPNVGKRVLWKKLLKYKVEYNPNIF